MDVATVSGLVSGTILVAAAILLGGNAGIFINLPGLIIVVGGTLATTLIKFSLGDLLNAITVVAKAFLIRSVSPMATIDRIIELAGIARRDGVLALEGKDFGDPFLARGLGMVIDGMEPAQVTTVLRRELQYSLERHKQGRNIFKGMGLAAPAFGMIGTLIGLVQMLASMDEPSKIGPAMAVALLTTLYGAIIANLVALPLADKLELRSREDSLTRELIIAGVAAMQRGDHPRLIEEQLKAFLSPKVRTQAQPKGAERA